MDMDTILNKVHTVINIQETACSIFLNTEGDNAICMQIFVTFTSTVQHKSAYHSKQIVYFEVIFIIHLKEQLEMVCAKFGAYTLHWQKNLTL